ncbi:MAG: hypothetical protein ACLT16_07045 [[Clostridium] innocuum]
MSIIWTESKGFKIALIKAETERFLSYFAELNGMNYEIVCVKTAMRRCRL